MNQIPVLPAWDFLLGPARSKIIFWCLSQIINPLLTKLVDGQDMAG